MSVDHPGTLTQAPGLDVEENAAIPGTQTGGRETAVLEQLHRFLDESAVVDDLEAAQNDQLHAQHGRFHIYVTDHVAHATDDALDPDETKRS
jgi:hypothetical protein